MPVDFLPHHANLSREHRVDLEENLKTLRRTTAVCTSTLELGIDIGDIECVAQIGPPFSVASLRQRLGRSGRRPGQPAVLRMYSIEREPQADSHPLDRLHLGLSRSIAMVELLIEGWCEPPAPEALHLSLCATRCFRHRRKGRDKCHNAVRCPVQNRSFQEGEPGALRPPASRSRLA